MSLGGQQLKRERHGPGAARDRDCAEPTLAEETVPLRDAGEQELQRSREERVRLVVAGSRRHRGPRLRGAAIVLAAVVGCAGAFALLRGGTSATRHIEAGAPARSTHALTVGRARTRALDARRHEEARHLAERRARREATRRRRITAARRARAKARARKEKGRAHHREALPATGALTSEAENSVPEEVPPEEVPPEEAAPPAEEPTPVATPVTPTSEPSTSTSSTSSSEEEQAQKEFGFER